MISIFHICLQSNHHYKILLNKSSYKTVQKCHGESSPNKAKPEHLSTLVRDVPQGLKIIKLLKEGDTLGFVWLT